MDFTFSNRQSKDDGGGGSKIQKEKWRVFKNLVFCSDNLFLRLRVVVNTLNTPPEEYDRKIENQGN